MNKISEQNNNPDPCLSPPIQLGKKTSLFIAKKKEVYRKMSVSVRILCALLLSAVVAHVTANGKDLPECRTSWPMTETPPSKGRYYISGFAREAMPTETKVIADLGTARDNIHSLQIGRYCHGLQFSDLLDEFARFKKKMASLENENKELKNNLSDLQNNFSDLQNNLTDLKNNVSDIQNKTISEKRELEEGMNSTVRKLKNELQKKDTSLDKEVTELKKKVGNLTDLAQRSQVFMAMGLNNPRPGDEEMLKFGDVKLGADSYARSTPLFEANFDAVYFVSFSMMAKSTDKRFVGAWLIKDGNNYLRIAADIDRKRSHYYTVVTISAAVQLKTGQKLGIKAATSGMVIAHQQFSVFLISNA